jgi:hypothetical protein
MFCRSILSEIDKGLLFMQFQSPFVGPSHVISFGGRIHGPIPTGGGAGGKVLRIHVRSDGGSCAPCRCQ